MNEVRPEDCGYFTTCQCGKRIWEGDESHRDGDDVELCAECYDEMIHAGEVRPTGETTACNKRATVEVVSGSSPRTPLHLLSTPPQGAGEVRMAMHEDDDTKVRTLCRAAATVLRMFKGGHNPTEYQLNRLEGAIANFMLEKACGHPLIDDCSCLDIQEAGKQVQ